MTETLVAVLMASLVGSLHCTGMCGAFVVLACAGEPGTGQRPSRITLHIAYHSGRLFTYSFFGIAAGALGATIDLGGSLVGLQRVATVLAAAVLVVFGTVSLMRALGLRSCRATPAAWMVRLGERGHRAAWTLKPSTRAWVIGLLTTLLPCGWLYAFVVISAGTGNPLSGALVMAAFWLGTLPALTILGAVIRVVAGPFATRMPVLTAVALIGLGGFTLVTRAGHIGLEIPLSSHDQMPPNNPNVCTSDIPACCK